MSKPFHVILITLLTSDPYRFDLNHDITHENCEPSYLNMGVTVRKCTSWQCSVPIIATALVFLRWKEWNTYYVS